VRAKKHSLDKDKMLKNLNGPFFNNLKKLALHKCKFYMCYKCKLPYFGGFLSSENYALYRKVKTQELICGECCEMAPESASSDQQEKCASHGMEHWDFKCKFCCSIACWFTKAHNGGHYCDKCYHERLNDNGSIDNFNISKCTGLPQDNCPLGVAHINNGSGKKFALGCGLCRKPN